MLNVTRQGISRHYRTEPDSEDFLVDRTTTATGCKDNAVPITKRRIRAPTGSTQDGTALRLSRTPDWLQARTKAAQADAAEVEQLAQPIPTALQRRAWLRSVGAGTAAMGMTQPRQDSPRTPCAHCGTCDSPLPHAASGATWATMRFTASSFISAETVDPIRMRERPVRPRVPRTTRSIWRERTKLGISRFGLPASR